MTNQLTTVPTLVKIWYGRTGGQYRIYQTGKRFTCNCPACSNGGCCYQRNNLKGLQFYQDILASKHSPKVREDGHKWSDLQKARVEQLAIEFMRNFKAGLIELKGVHWFWKHNGKIYA